MLRFIQKVLLDLLNEKQTERSMFELEVKEILHVTLNEPWIVCPTATGNSAKRARIFNPIQSTFPYCTDSLVRGGNNFNVE